MVYIFPFSQESFQGKKPEGQGEKYLKLLLISFDSPGFQISLLGLGNQLLMLAVCLAILLSSASGLWIWWKRKPAGRLGVPPLRHELPRWKSGIAIMLALGVAFPLVGASLLLVWALDWLVLSRLPAVRRVLA